jgi:TRAP-type C4-dicarboxylate transport system substrate-binding protein
MPQISLRLAGYQPARSVHTRAMHMFADALHRRLGDRIDIRYTENVTAAGRNAADLLAMTEGDELDICYFASSYLAERVPSLGLFDLPFHVTERGAAYALADGAAGRWLADDVAASTGFSVLAYWDNGFRHISNGRRPIAHPRDCRGLKIRTLDNALHQRVFRSLGFEPMVIDVKELAAAVREGRVDAQENPLTNLINFNLHKTHRFVTLTGHFFGVALVLCNRARLTQWPQDVRGAVAEAMTEATAAQRRHAAEDDELCLATLKADGVEIIGPDRFDRVAFVDAVADIRAEAAKAASVPKFA